MWCLLDTSTRICKYKVYSETVCLICNSYNLKLQQKKLDKRLYRQAAIVGSEFQNQNAKTQIINITILKSTNHFGETTVAMPLFSL